MSTSENGDPGSTLMVSAPTREMLLGKLSRGDHTDSGGDFRLVVFNPDEERIRQARAIVEKDEPNRGTYDIWFSHTSLLTRGGRLAYVFPGFWDELITETDSLSDACGLPRMDQLIADMKPTHTNGRYYQHRYNTKWLCKTALEKLGVTPDMYLGYSLGEWEAALFAGIITCDIDTWTDNFSAGWDSYEYYYPLVVVDGADRGLIDEWCRDIPDLYLSIDNCPSQVILTGTEPAIATVMRILDETNITHIVIPNRTALHTPLAAEIPSNKFAIFHEVEIHDGRIPVWSSATLETIPTNQEPYLDYLFTELTKTVRFREAVAKLYEEQQVRLFIQIGPGPLPNYVANTLSGKDFGAISTSITDRDGADQLRRVMALLYIEGRSIDPGFIGVSQRVAPMRRTPVDANSSIAAAVHRNIQHMASLEQRMASLSKNLVSAQQEMETLFERVPSVALSPIRTQRKGTTFEETLTLTLDDHPYLMDHSIIRQPPDWPIREDLNPVVPLTMIIELFAETAMRHAPGEKLVKVTDVTAFRWIEVAAPVDIQVKGEWSSNDTLRLSFEGYASGECSFAASFPQPDTEVGSDVDLGEQIAAPASSEQWYEKFTFHGPRYRSLVQCEKICEHGVVGIAENKGGKGSMLDAVGQLLGLFVHITQTTDTIVFPISVKELTLYADIHDQAGLFEDTMIVTKVTDTSAQTDTIVRRDGLIWCVVHGLVLQRFASTPSLWQVILDPKRQTLACEIAPGVYWYDNTLHDNILAILTKRYLSAPERDYYKNLRSPQHKRENLVSRIALKDAVRSWLAGPDADMMYPVQLSCVHDDKGQPWMQGYGPRSRNLDDVHVSLSHKGNAAAAIVGDKPVGIDVEKIADKSPDFLDVAFTEKERELLASSGESDTVIRFWVAKEAYSKMLGEGLQGYPKRYEVISFDADTVVIGNVEIHTSRIGDDYIVGWTPTQ